MIDRRIILSVAAAVVAASTPVAAQASKDPNYVEVTQRVADRRVDVTVGGKRFTSYIWPTSLKKPVLYPLISASGATVTRGFPLEPRPGERVDHPHHAGMWFNYGDVNGLDFWNNSDSIRAAQAPRMGSIVHKSIRASKSGAGEGSLDVTMEWVDSKNAVLLREDTKFIFRAKAGMRTVDRITTLTALDSTIRFTDNKEGVLGIRVARSLEQPSMQADKYTDASGNITPMAKIDTAGAHGWYTSSEGKEGDAVWGTRGKWAMLTGDAGGVPVTLAVLDHPSNVGYPTYWHARGYGLFGANPLGQKALSGGKDELNYKLEPGKSVVFRHQVLILDGKAKTADIENYWAGFTR